MFFKTRQQARQHAKHVNGKVVDNGKTAELRWRVMVVEVDKVEKIVKLTLKTKKSSNNNMLGKFVGVFYQKSDRKAQYAKQVKVYNKHPYSKYVTTPAVV
jgi:hypothetical protein